MTSIVAQGRSNFNACAFSRFFSHGRAQCENVHTVGARRTGRLFFGSFSKLPTNSVLMKLFRTRDFELAKITDEERRFRFRDRG